MLAHLAACCCLLHSFSAIKARSCFVDEQRGNCGRLNEDTANNPQTQSTSTPSFIFACSVSLTRSLVYTHTQSHSLTHPHTHTQSHAPTRTVSRTHTHSLSSPSSLSAMSAPKKTRDISVGVLLSKSTEGLDIAAALHRQLGQRASTAATKHQGHVLVCFLDEAVGLQQQAAAHGLAVVAQLTDFCKRTSILLAFITPSRAFDACQSCLDSGFEGERTVAEFVCACMAQSRTQSCYCFIVLPCSRFGCNTRGRESVCVSVCVCACVHFVWVEI